MARHKAIPLSGTRRTEFGKGSARRARREGLIPVVLYGPEIEAPLHATVNRREFTAIVRGHGSNAVVELAVDGEQHLALIKHIDQNVLSFEIDHVDLYAIRRGEKVEVEVPVTYTGEIAPGAMLMQDADVVMVEADVLSIPEELVINVEGAEIGTQFTADQIPLPEGVTLISEPDLLVINVVEPVVEDLPEPGEGDEAAEGEAAESSEGNE